MNWHRLGIPEVFELLSTNHQGLSTNAAEEKLLKIGPNELQEGKKKSIADMLLAQFKDVMILILLAAAIISGIIGDLTDTIVILVIVLLNDKSNEYKFLGIPSFVTVSLNDISNLYKFLGIPSFVILLLYDKFNVCKLFLPIV